MKSHLDDEALVVGHELGSGRLAGLLGALVCRSRSGKVFKVGSGFTDAQRAAAAAPRVGCVVSYKYAELTDDGLPRFPTFLRERADGDPLDFAAPSGE